MKFHPSMLMFATLTLSPAFAGVGPNTVDINAIREDEARQTLREMAGRAARVQVVADRLLAMIADTRFTRQAHAEELTEVKADLNRLGRDAARVASLRESLPAWQQEAVDRLMPALRESAAAAEKAIVFTRDHPQQLWAPENAAVTRELYAHSRQMAQLLHEALKAGPGRETEQRVATTEE